MSSDPFFITIPLDALSERHQHLVSFANKAQNPPLWFVDEVRNGEVTLRVTGKWFEAGDAK